MAVRKGQILLEDARIIFRNFEGRETTYNRKGDRNFCVILDEDLSEKLKSDGWNVKYLKPREEGDTPTPYLEVAVSCKKSCPLIRLITSRGPSNLTEREFEMVDQVDIEQVDMLINPYHWGPMPDGREGIRAYLEAIYITIHEDPLQLKYGTFGQDPTATDIPLDAEGREVV